MVIAVVPSRFHSSRFPGKPLALVAGVPLIARVVQRVQDAGVADQVVVATDDARIGQCVGEQCPGVRVWRDGRAWRTGSDRVAAAVDALGLDAETIINVQGDEPLVDGEALQRAVAALRRGEIGTVAVPVVDPAQLDDPDTVKVVVDDAGRALRFSRRSLGGAALAHVGVYAFGRAALARFAALPTGQGERQEGLEQLRALESGMRIGVSVGRGPCASINRPADVARLEGLL